jgi:hypothetical protein
VMTNAIMAAMASVRSCCALAVDRCPGSEQSGEGCDSAVVRCSLNNVCCLWHTRKALADSATNSKYHSLTLSALVDQTSATKAASLRLGLQRAVLVATVEPGQMWPGLLLLVCACICIFLVIAIGSSPTSLAVRYIMPSFSVSVVLCCV